MVNKLLCSVSCVFFFFVATNEGLSAPPQPAALNNGKAATALVVLDDGWEGYATAFCVDPSGLFVTTSRVAEASGSIVLILNIGEETERQLDAQVVHEDRSKLLALLQVKGGTNLPTLSLGTDKDLTEVMDLTVLGFPLGRGLSLGIEEQPAITVTMGKVTALRKNGERVEAVQLDAALNPGSGGGPVLDATGRVLGVVVFGTGGTGIGFAVPVNQLRDFLTQPKIQWVPPAVQFDDLHKEITFRVRLSGYAPWINPDLNVSLELRFPGISTRQFAMLAENGEFRVDAPLLQRSKDAEGVTCSASLSGAFVRGSTEDRKFKIGNRELQLSTLRELTPQSPAKALLVDGTTLEGKLDGLENLTLKVGENRVTVELSDASRLVFNHKKNIDQVYYTVTVKQKDQEIARQKGIIRLRDLHRPLYQLFIQSRQDKITKKLPSTIHDLCLGAGGRLLIFHFHKLHLLGLFDRDQAKFIGYIPMPEDSVFAAGLEHLIIVEKTKKLIHRWNLKTLQRERTAVLNLRPESTIAWIAMGYASKGPLCISYTHAQAVPTLFDLKTLEPRALHVEKFQKIGIHAESVVRASRDGSIFTFWAPKEAEQRSLLLGKAFAVLHENRARGWGLVGGPNAEYIFSSGGIINLEMQKITPPPNRWFVPAVGSGTLCLSVRSQPHPTNRLKDMEFVRIHVVPDPRPILLLKHALTPQRSESHNAQKQSLSYDKRLLLYPDEDLIITIPKINDRLILHRFDLDSELGKLGTDYLLVVSDPPRRARIGTIYRHTLDVRSSQGGLRFRLEAAPEGMTISPEGTIRWSVPSYVEDEKHRVVVAVTDHAEREALKTFWIRVEMQKGEGR